MATQHEIGSWGDETFPLSTPRSVMAHLADEIAELADEIETFSERPDETTRAALAEEAADCYLLLTHIAHKCGFDLKAAADVKFAKNQRRTWGKPDDRGVVRHVDEPEMG